MALALALPGGAGAQLLGGQAVEARSGQPITGLLVRLVRHEAHTARRTPADSARTDARGLFEITASSPGTYQLEFVPHPTAVTRGPVDTIAADSTLLRRYAVPVPVRADATGLAFLEFEVDKPVGMRPGQPPPRYPPELRRQEIEGEVLVQFVVDTTGKLLPGSFRVLHSTHQLFTRSVEQAILQMRFKAAELHGAKVPQLAQMPFVFSIRGRAEVEWPAPDWEPPTRRRPIFPHR